MKIIEALKKIKDLLRKADDLKGLVAQHCVDLDCETPAYPDQKQQVRDWLQAHSDTIKEVLRLKYCIQKTNINTQVTIELGGQHVTKSITEWILRRKELAKIEESLQRSLTFGKWDKEEYKQAVTPNTPERVYKRRLYFDPIERDKKIEMYRSEPSAIDSTLEVINAVTDLIEN